MEQVKALNEIGWGTVFTVLFLLILALPNIWESISKFVNLFGIETKWSLRAKEKDELLIKLSNGFDTLKADIKCLSNKSDLLETSLKELGDKVQCMEDKSDERKRAELKDKIASSYRYYKQKKEWTKMEKEAFDGLIKAYERCGGLNSFVHEICLPESLTWIIIDE